VHLFDFGSVYSQRDHKFDITIELGCNMTDKLASPAAKLAPEQQEALQQQ